MEEAQSGNLDCGLPDFAALHPGYRLPTTVVARLDRAIQYSSAIAIDP
jgi:hypothetical protein